MAVFRVEKNHNYTVMSNYHLRDTGLTLKAIGLLSKMLSLTDEWDYTTRGLAAICKEGVDAIGAALKELETRGYLVRRQIRDSKGRKWSVVYDSSIKCVDKNGCSASRNYAVELVTPVLEYEDMSLLQEVVRAIRKAGGMTGAEYQAGIHVHIDGAPYTAQSLRNLVNIFASKENFLFDMLQVSPLRETYCQKVDRDFLEKLNKQKPKTIEGIQKLWYRGDMNEVHHHYSSTRYRACNLHSFFANGNWEMRACNSTLHAGVIRSYVTLALAISNAALTKKFCSPHISESDNLRYSARVWLINLGLNGDEFKNCRKHLISHLEGNIAWLHPEDAIKQRERIKAERIAARTEPMRTVQQQDNNIPDEAVEPQESEREAVFEDEDLEQEEAFGATRS